MSHSGKGQFTRGFLTSICIKRRRTGIRRKRSGTRPVLTFSFGTAKKNSLARSFLDTKKYLDARDRFLRREIYIFSLTNRKSGGNLNSEEKDVQKVRVAVQQLHLVTGQNYVRRMLISYSIVLYIILYHV